MRNAYVYLSILLGLALFLLVVFAMVFFRERLRGALKRRPRKSGSRRRLHASGPA